MADMVSMDELKNAMAALEASGLDYICPFCLTTGRCCGTCWCNCDPVED